MNISHNFSRSNDTPRVSTMIKSFFRSKPEDTSIVGTKSSLQTNMKYGNRMNVTSPVPLSSSGRTSPNKTSPSYVDAKKTDDNGDGESESDGDAIVYND